MRSSRKRVEVSTCLSLAACLTLFLNVRAGSAQTKRSCEAIEAFMRTARTNVLRGQSALMDDGSTQHRVFVHTKDESRAQFQRRDTWKANVAAYELAKILEINIMPPYVEAKVNGKPASVSWGLDHLLMDEAQRNERNVQPPDPEAWNKQMYVVRVFDELVSEGFLPGELLITRDWQVWAVGPSQAFPLNKTIQNPGNLVKCDRKLLTKMRTLDRDVLMIKLGNWLTKEEVEAVLVRAAQIVRFFDREIAAKGEAAVLFDLDRSGSPCAL